MIVVYGDVAGLSEIYLTDDESMATMKKASQEQLACDIPPTKRKYFGRVMRGKRGKRPEMMTGGDKRDNGSWKDDAN